MKILKSFWNIHRPHIIVHPVVLLSLTTNHVHIHRWHILFLYVVRLLTTLQQDLNVLQDLSVAQAHLLTYYLHQVSQRNIKYLAVFFVGEVEAVQNINQLSLTYSGNRNTFECIHLLLLFHYSFSKVLGKAFRISQHMESLRTRNLTVLFGLTLLLFEKITKNWILGIVDFIVRHISDFSFDELGVRGEQFGWNGVFVRVKPWGPRIEIFHNDIVFFDILQFSTSEILANSGASILDPCIFGFNLRDGNQ